MDMKFMGGFCYQECSHFCDWKRWIKQVPPKGYCADSGQASDTWNAKISQFYLIFFIFLGFFEFRHKNQRTKAKEIRVQPVVWLCLCEPLPLTPTCPMGAVIPSSVSQEREEAVTDPENAIHMWVQVTVFKVIGLAKINEIEAKKLQSSARRSRFF